MIILFIYCAGVTEARGFIYISQYCQLTIGSCRYLSIKCGSSTCGCSVFYSSFCALCKGIQVYIIPESFGVCGFVGCYGNH